jgi:putative hemolysin
MISGFAEWALAAGLLFAAALLTLFAYVDRLYTEMGKFFLRGVQDNLEVFERDVEPTLKMDRGRAGLTFALLTQLMILILAVLAAYWALAHDGLQWDKAIARLALLLAAVLVFAHLIPHVLITRTRGDWLASFAALLRVASWAALPAVVVLSFSFSVSDLAKPEEEKHADSTAEEMEALMDKGEEHGLLEEEDRKLIQSVVEFGDKVVREVMTPRPNVLAVERNATLEELLHAIEDKHYSRVPVYDGTLDNIVGIVYTRELIQMTDQELKQTRAWERVREIPVVPETKPVTDLLRELQRGNQRMAVVVDEYGGVSGIATIEDLVEEIVGEIGDEGEPPDATPQADGSLVISGQAELDSLERHFGAMPQAEGDFTTVAGLVNTIAGRVPAKGEVIEADGLRFEVLEASETLVERLRVSRVAAKEDKASL